MTNLNNQPCNKEKKGFNDAHQDVGLRLAMNQPTSSKDHEEGNKKDEITMKINFPESQKSEKLLPSYKVYTNTVKSKTRGKAL